MGIVYSVAFNVHSGISTFAQQYFSSIPYPDDRGDPGVSLFKAYPIDKLGPAEIGLFTLGVQTPEDRPLDISLLNLLAQIRGIKDVLFGWPFLFQNLPEGYSIVRSKYRYALLDVTTDESVSPRTKTEPFSRLTSDMIRRWKSSTLADVGLTPIADFDNAGKHIVLLRVSKESLLVF